VIAILQPGIDRLAREGCALPGMAQFKVLQHILHLLDQGVVLEKVAALLQHNPIDKWVSPSLTSTGVLSGADGR
jgi:hypothetical protein